MSELGDRLRARPKEILREIASVAAPEIQAALKADAPVLTGAYRDSLYARNDGTNIAIGSALRYARFVESRVDVRAVIARVVRNAL